MMPETDAKSRTQDEDGGLYSLFGGVIESDVNLPNLPAVDRGSPSVKICRHRSDGIPLDSGQPVYELLDSAGALVYRLVRHDEQYSWWYPNVGRFGISRDGRLIRWASQHANLADISAVLTGPILGFALQLQGQTSLHGSAVVMAEGAVGILAPSGCGKSTTAVALISKGCQLLTDDVLALEIRSERVSVLPGYPVLKLWPDSLDRLVNQVDWQALPRHTSWLEKRVLRDTDLATVGCSARPLAALIALSPTGPDSNIELRRLRGREALLALVAHGYNVQLLAQEPGLLSRQLSIFSRIAESTPVYVIRYPRTFERLGEVADAIVGCARPASQRGGVR
jgi:hypothetical protein